MATELQTTISKSQVAYMLGYLERNVTIKQNDNDNPLPVIQHGRGKANEYDLNKLNQWIRRDALKDAGIGEDGELYSYDVERARLTHHQANKTELEAKSLNGELLKAEDVEADMTSMVAELRSRLLGLPMRIAQVAISARSLKEIETACSIEIDRMLDELSSNAQQYYVADIGESMVSPQSAATPIG